MWDIVGLLMEEFRSRRSQFLLPYSRTPDTFSINLDALTSHFVSRGDLRDSKNSLANFAAIYEA